MTVPIEPAETVCADVAIGWLSPGETVHALSWRPGGGVLIGADWPRGEVEELFRTAVVVDIAGPGARSHGYGLGVWVDDRRRCLFFKSDVPESAVRYHHDDPVGLN